MTAAQPIPRIAQSVHKSLTQPTHTFTKSSCFLNASRNSSYLCAGREPGTTNRPRDGSADAILARNSDMRDGSSSKSVSRPTTSGSDEPFEKVRVDDSTVFRPDAAYDIVDQASPELFPANDHPSWVAGRQGLHAARGWGCRALRIHVRWFQNAERKVACCHR